MSVDSRNTFVYSPLDLWDVATLAAGTTLAIASTVAGGASVKNVAKRVGITLSAPAAGQVAPTAAVLHDSATAPTVITGVTCKKFWNISAGLAAVSAGLTCVNIDEDNLHIDGTAATAMTLEFLTTGGGVTTPITASLSSVFLQGYIFPKANPVTVTNPS